MLALEVIVAVAVLAGVAVVAVGRGDPMAPPEPRPEPVLGTGRLTAADLDRVRFRVALRGYRMDEVDLVLRRAAAALSELESRPQQPEPAEPPQPAAGAAPARAPGDPEPDIGPGGP